MDAHVPLLIKAEHVHIAQHRLAPSEVIRNLLSSVKVTMLSAMSSNLVTYGPMSVLFNFRLQ